MAGFVYQQDYAALRILASAAIQSVDSYPACNRVTAFRIEGRTSPEGPIWDVILTAVGASKDLLECKNADGTSYDRRVFYQRVRQEAKAASSVSRLRVGWVVNPHKQSGNFLQHLAELRTLASGTPATVPQLSPRAVNSGRTALQEALYSLQSKCPAARLG